MFDIQEQLKLLPDEPGVYLMKNKNDKIIYVGKAISLKNRVRQYFQSSKNHSSKVRSMVENIASFEYIITDSELEALILEPPLLTTTPAHIRLQDSCYHIQVHSCLT